MNNGEIRLAARTVTRPLIAAGVRDRVAIIRSIAELLPVNEITPTIRDEIIAGVMDELEGPSTKPLNRIALADLFDQPIDSPPWVVPQWLCRNEVVCIAGEWSAGKSLLALDLSIGLSRVNREEARFLGSLEILGGQQRVLCLDEENSEMLVRRRLQQMAVAKGIARAELAAMPLQYLTRNGINLDDPSLFDAVRRECDTFNPDWIVLDSLVRFHRRDENSNSQMAEFFGDRIRPLLDEFGCGVAFPHHLSKPSAQGRKLDIGHRMRGASDIAGFCDQVWGIEKQGEARSLVHVKTRWGAPAGELSVSIEETLDGEGLLITGDAPLGQADSIAWKLLTNAEAAGVLRQDIVKAIEAGEVPHPEKTTTRTLGRYHGQGKVRKRKEGKATRYWLSRYAPEDAK